MVTRLVVALDVATLDEAVSLAARLQPHVDGFKVGLELLMGVGPTAVTRINDLGSPVFVDAKLHDIPNTVGAAARRLGRLGARWVTAHASGGAEMMAAAVQGLGDASDGRGGILGVTALTSLSAGDLPRLGVTRVLGEHVVELARLAASVGSEGVVCAVPEARAVADLGLGILVVTPGIRPGGSGASDQRRVATPAAAVRAGSDLLVVGRPITAAPDPVAAAEAISGEIESAHIAQGA